MEKPDNQLRELKDNSEAESIEFVLFQVSECYVYLIPPRKSAASYRADEWNVNKWAWDGILKVISRGEECIIKLEDKTSGELYARAFLRSGEPHPVEPVIDSSRYFVLRIEEKMGARTRHAFIGIGFRERTEAYDFQAALHDHMKYLDKKKTAEEMDRQFQSSGSLDYSLKEGQTLILQLKNVSHQTHFFEGASHVSVPPQSNRGGKSKLSEQISANQPVDDAKEQIPAIQPPPPPPVLSPLSRAQELTEKQKGDEADDFGDFQAA